jgi:sugar lactone lactonase YvrE
MRRSLGFALVLVSGAAQADGGHFPAPATVTTLALFPWQTEGLTSDGHGHLYTAARNASVQQGTVRVPDACPVYRVNLFDGASAIVGYVPTPNHSDVPPPPNTDSPNCVTSGLAFDAAGDLYVASAATVAGVAFGQVFRMTPDPAAPPTGTVFATAVPGANGIAFDRAGNLWVTDGTTGQGRIWRIPPSGGSGLDPGNERFRVQAMLNGKGVGRQIKSAPPGVAGTSAGDVIVANGVAFARSGELLIADTARGAIWRVELDRNGELMSPTGCDTTFSPNTLCLSNVLVAHPYLESVDGIALDAAGNIWGVANARQAVVVVDTDRNVHEIFRNPVNETTGLRNGGQSVGDNHIVEFPASPYLVGDRFCTSTFDGTPPSSRDNAPPDAGEINPTGAWRGKISCMDQRLAIPGLPLPIN